MKRLCILILSGFFLSTGVVYAEPPIDAGGAIDLDQVLPTPRLFIQTTLDAMERLDLAQNVNSLGMVLLFASFVYSLISATYFFRSDQYFSIFGRLIIAAGLIWGSPIIAKTTLNIWESTYNRLESSVAKPALDRLEENMGRFTPALKATAELTVALELAAAIIPDTAGVDAFEEGAKLAAQATSQLTRGLFLLVVLMGSIYGVYFLAIYTSALTVILAGLLMPIIAAFLVLPGMASWFGRWFNMLVVALVTLVVFPFVLFVAVELGVNQPVQNMTNVFEQIQRQGEEIKRLADAKPESVLDVAGWINFASRLRNILSPLEQIKRLIATWIFDLVMVAIGILASIFMMRQVPSLIAGFIGGVAGSLPGAASGGAMAGLLSVSGPSKMKLGGGGGGGGGGASQLNSSSAPQSSPPGGSRALSSGGGGSAGALPPSGGSGGGQRAIGPSGGSGGGSQRAVAPAGGSGGGSSGGQARVAPSAPSSEGTVTARGDMRNLRNDPNTVNTTARSG